jgi:protein-disulfide isomerase
MDEAIPVEVDTIEEEETGFKEQPAKSLSTRLFAMLVPLAFVLGLGAGYLVWGRGGEASVQAGANPPEAQAAAAEATPRKVTRYDVPVDDDPAFGPESAAITIIEFSDYQCPFCTKWYDEVWTRLKTEYPTQVRLVYRDFPLTSIHPDAIPAAEAANCANEQGAYWDYHDKLFSGELGLGREALDQYASQLNLDADSFKKCVDERRYQAEVENDLNYAMNLGVRSTPTFFVNGIALVGAQPYEVFKDVIDKELAGEIPK